MKLYGSLTSPYARKVRICLLELGLDYEFIVKAPADPDVVRLNPLAKVPLLQRDDGEVIFDSPVIVEYLDDMADGSLIPATIEHWRVQRWHALADGILDAVVARMLELRRPDEKQDTAVIQKQEGKVAAALQYAETHYSGKQFLEADQFSIADIAFAVALDYIDFRYPHDWRSGHPRLAQWLSEITQRSSFNQTVAVE